MMVSHDLGIPSAPLALYEDNPSVTSGQAEWANKAEFNFNPSMDM